MIRHVRRNKETDNAMLYTVLYRNKTMITIKSGTYIMMCCTHPRTRLHCHEKSGKIRYAANATVAASAKHGNNVSRATTPLRRRNWLASSSSPPLINVTASETSLKTKCTQLFRTLFMGKEANQYIPYNLYALPASIIFTEKSRHF